MASLFDNLLTLMRQIRKLEITIQKQNEYIMELENRLPMDIMRPDNIPIDHLIRRDEGITGKWLGTFVGITLIFRDDNTIEHGYMVADGIYPGPREEALNTLGKHIYKLVSPIPLEEDMSKKRTGLEALTHEDLNEIFTDLARFYWWDIQQYEDRRREIFHQWIWLKLDKPEYEFTRDQAMNKYYRFVENSFIKTKARLARYRRSSS